MQQGMIDAKQLEELADAGEIDTVLCMFTDFQGRFVGKRIAPALLPRGRAGRGGPARVPLPARDRHGDGAAARLRVRELGDRLRRLQDAPRHVDAAPRPVAREDRDGDLRRRRRAHGRAGRGGAAARSSSGRSSARRRPATRSRPARSSSSTSSRTPTRRPRPSATRASSRRPRTSWTTTCSQTTKDEWLIRQIRNGMDGAGIPSSSRRASSGGASTRSTSATPTRWRRPTATRSTRTARRRSPR